MPSVKHVLSVIEDFLHESQKLGIIKEFSVVYNDSDETENSGSEELLLNFMKKLNEESMEIETKSAQSVIQEQAFEQIENESQKNDLVQIQIDTNEMKRRISSFIARKRKEVDEWNVQEFCGRSYVDEQHPSWEEQDSCARVDAVFIPRRGCKSHIKVSKVENNYGPQTIIKKIKTEINDENENVISEVIDERLKHMEHHLKLETDSSLRSSIFERLKNLEERILYLEGLSPEYIHIANSEYSSPKKNFSEKEKLYSNWSIPDLNKRIKTLKEMLKKK